MLEPSSSRKGSLCSSQVSSYTRPAGPCAALASLSSLFCVFSFSVVLSIPCFDLLEEGQFWQVRLMRTLTDNVLLIDVKSKAFIFIADLIAIIVHIAFRTFMVFVVSHQEKPLGISPLSLLDFEWLMLIPYPFLPIPVQTYSTIPSSTTSTPT